MSSKRFRFVLCLNIFVNLFYFIMVMFREGRNNFVNLYKHSPKKQEDIFYTNKYKNEDVNCVNNFYIEYCDETTMITNIDEFFDSGWYNKYNNLIDNITNYSEVKDLIIELKKFKLILKIQDDKMDKSKIEKDLLKCIIKRIQYKYKCILESNRDTGHNVENLKQIYHYNKLIELKKLFKQILDKRIELKEKFLEDDIEINKNLSNTSGSFEPVKRKKKKNSRKKH